jgi:hypothetical protein
MLPMISTTKTSGSEIRFLMCQFINDVPGGSLL